MSPEIEVYMARGRRERAKAFHAGFAALGAWLRRAFAGRRAPAGPCVAHRR
jgi:hypothetical protein